MKISHRITWFLRGRVWVISEKNILHTDFGGKKLLQGNTWQKNPSRKKISFMAYNAGKKSYTIVCHEKNFHERLPQTKSGKEILHNRPSSSSSSFISLCVTVNFRGCSWLLGEETSRNHQAYKERPPRHHNIIKNKGCEEVRLN